MNNIDKKNLKKLKEEFADIQQISTDKFKKIKKALINLDNETLKAFVIAKINFISNIALSTLTLDRDLKIEELKKLRAKLD